MTLNQALNISNRKCFLVLGLTATLLIVSLPEYTVLPVIHSIWVPDIILPEGICRARETEAVGLVTNTCRPIFTAFNTTSLGDRLRDFQPTIVQGQSVMCPLVKTLDIITKALKDAEVPYFIHSGTLLGSWRHHGFIPWDHDTDISVPWESKPKIMQVFRTLPQSIGLVIKHHLGHWKFFINDSCEIQTKGFPFVTDMFFYHEQDGYIVDEEVDSFSCLKFPRHWIFPVTYRPFNGLQLASPARSDLVIDHCFQGEDSMDICKNVPWTDGKTMRVNCTELLDVYPFVKRSKVKGNVGCNESLTFNGSVLSWFVGNYSC